MFCTKCGKEIEADTKFCRYCGAPVQGIPLQEQQVDFADSSGGSKVPGKKGVIIALSLSGVLVAAAAVGGVLYFTGDSRHSAKETDFVANESDEDRDIKKDSQKASSEDEDKMTASPQAELLRKYFDEELIPQYGYVDLNAQIKRFDYDTIYDVTDQNELWTSALGITDAKICDLDDDGSEELIVFLLTEDEISINIYEVQDDAVQEAAVASGSRSSDLDGYDITWSMLEADGVTYLFYEESSYGIIWDFSTENAKLYRYDGEHFYTPLAILQTAGGSSDFQYTAFQYNADGDLLSEEIIYSEIDDMFLDNDHFCQRTEELFAAYGISLDNEASRRNRQDIYQGIQSVDGYEALLTLEMWADSDFQNNILTYHFNDLDSPSAFYRRFMAGGETVHIPEEVWYYGNEHTAWTLQDILNQIQDSYLEYSDRIPYVQYAYLDCGGDGVEELAIRFVGLNLYSPDDDSDLTMIISCREGALEAVYACESWARSITTVNYYGCIYGSGSAGAGDHLFDMGYIDGNGDLQTVYVAEELGGWWMRNLSEDAYDAAFDTEPGAAVTQYTINGVDYCVLDTFDSDTDDPMYQNYIALCEQEGRHFTTDDKISEVIEQQMAAFGIEKAWTGENELSWNYCYW